MRDELAVETIEKSFKIKLNHPIIQQRLKLNLFSAMLNNLPD